jgi:hypothetical protein
MDDAALAKWLRTNVDISEIRSYIDPDERHRLALIAERLEVLSVILAVNRAQLESARLPYED